jgi:hypothetical protein
MGDASFYLGLTVRTLENSTSRMARAEYDGLQDVLTGRVMAEAV